MGGSHRPNEGSRVGPARPGVPGERIRRGRPDLHRGIATCGRRRAIPGSGRRDHPPSDGRLLAPARDGRLRGSARGGRRPGRRRHCAVRPVRDRNGPRIARGGSPRRRDARTTAGRRNDCRMPTATSRVCQHPGREHPTARYVRSGAGRHHDPNVRSGAGRHHDPSARSGAGRHHDPNVRSGAGRHHDPSARSGAGRHHDPNARSGASRHHDPNARSGASRRRDPSARRDRERRRGLEVPTARDSARGPARRADHRWGDHGHPAGPAASRRRARLRSRAWRWAFFSDVQRGFLRCASPDEGDEPERGIRAIGDTLLSLMGADGTHGRGASAPPRAEQHRDGMVLVGGVRADVASGGRRRAAPTSDRPGGRIDRSRQTILPAPRRGADRHRDVTRWPPARHLASTVRTGVHATLGMCEWPWSRNPSSRRSTG